jgi:hypothetical protein
MPISCYTVHLVMPEADAERTSALASLEAMLAGLPETGFAEVWVMHGRFPALCALLNGDRAWLTCLRADGDAGFSSRNPGYAGPPDAEMEFMLSTGQRDRYPAAVDVFTRRGAGGGAVVCRRSALSCDPLMVQRLRGRRCVARPGMTIRSMLPRAVDEMASWEVSPNA